MESLDDFMAILLKPADLLFQFRLKDNSGIQEKVELKSSSSEDWGATSLESV